MKFIESVVDRSEADLLEYKALYDKGWENMTPEEQETWLHGMKGALNLSDMRRVLNNIEFVNRLKKYQLIVPEQDDYILYESRMTDISMLLMFIYNDAPLLPYNTIDKWNEIEALLKTTYDDVTKNNVITGIWIISID